MSLLVQHPGATSLRLLTFGPGAIFGELALLDGQARSADAVADVASELWALPRARFEALADTDPPLYAAALRGIALHMVGRLRDTTALLEERA